LWAYVREEKDSLCYQNTGKVNGAEPIRLWKSHGKKGGRKKPGGKVGRDKWGRDSTSKTRRHVRRKENANGDTRERDGAIGVDWGEKGQEWKCQIVSGTYSVLTKKKKLWGEGLHAAKKGGEEPSFTGMRNSGHVGNLEGGGG